MSEHDLPADAARLLAETHLARGLVRDIARPRAPHASVSIAELWAHARRAPGAAVSFSVETVLRRDPEAARRYRALLASAAIAHAPLAIAASTGAVSQRRVGTATITIDDGEAGAPPLVLIAGFGARAPVLIEIMLGKESLRLGLPEPAGETIMLSADPDLPEMAVLLRLLRDPASEIFLL